MSGCRVHRRLPRPCAGELQLRLVVRLDDDPMVDLAAANVLLVLLDELRAGGLVVHQVRLQIDG